MARLRWLCALALLPCLSGAEIQYTLSPEPQNRAVRVVISLDDPKPSETFRIPAWCPGFYFLLNYQDKIYDFKASGPDGAALSVSHGSDPRAWTVSNPAGQPITVSYRVRGDDSGLGFFRTNVLAHTAFVNGPSAFMYADGRLTEPVKLAIREPEGWQTEVALEQDGDQYKASGYDELIDSPIQMGHFEVRRFTQMGVPFDVVFVSKDQQYRPNLDKETERLKSIALPALKLFGGASFKRYIFFIHLAVGDFDGGLEHRACNVQAVANANPLGIDDLAAHEYFHAWNVKQIRPKVLGPFDYTKQQRTANLWFAEGVTDYYAKITTYRSGLHDMDWLLADFTQQIRSLQKSKARRRYTLADTSREAWEHGGFGIDDLSYYVKGLLVGWILDAEIRDATDGEKCLDDVMRLMYARYKLPQPGYDESGVLQAINEVSGVDMSKLYHQMVDSTDELPYQELGKLGITVDPDTWIARIDVQANSKATELRKQWLDRPGGIR